MKKILRQQQRSQQTVNNSPESGEIVTSSRALPAVEPVEQYIGRDPVAEELKRVDNDLKKGLLDKVGDGANTNIIRLGDQIKKLADTVKTTAASAVKSATRPIEYDTARIEAARLQGDKYIPGLKEGIGLRKGGALSSLKNLLKLQPFKDFDLESIDETSLLGGSLKRSLASRQYAADQLAMSKTQKGEIRADVRRQAQYQDESGEFSERIFKKRKAEEFRQQNKLRGELREALLERDRLKFEDGYSDEQIRKTGLYRTIQRQETELAKLDPTKFGKEVKELKKKASEEDAKARISKSAESVAARPISKSAAPIVTQPQVRDQLGGEPVDVSEREAEALHAMNQHILILKQIEENTRPLKDLKTILAKSLSDLASSQPLLEDNIGDQATDIQSVDIDIDRPRRKPRAPSRKSSGPGRIARTWSKLRNVGSRAAGAIRPIGGVMAPIAARGPAGAAAALALYGASIAAEYAIERAEELTSEDSAISDIQKSVGGEGLKPIAEMSAIEKLESETDTGWWDIFGSKKETLHKKYKGLIERGQTYSPEEAKVLKKNLGIDVPKDNIVESLKDKPYEGELKELVKYDEKGNAVWKIHPKHIDMTKAEPKSESKSESPKDELIAPVEPSPKIGASDTVSSIPEKVTPEKPPRAMSSDEKRASANRAQMKSNNERVKAAAEKRGLNPNDVTGKFVGGELIALQTKDGETIDVSDQLTPSQLENANIAKRMSAEMDISNAKVLTRDSIQAPRDVSSPIYEDSLELKVQENTPRAQPIQNVVNAPSTNINQTSQYITKPTARNTDSTYREYSRSRFSDF